MERVHFLCEKEFRQEVDKLFQEQKQRIQALLPEADIQHVGSTAVPNSLTKGDLDIQVRVPAELFTQAVDTLANLYASNEGSVRTDFFAAFKDDSLNPPLGVQLSIIGSEYDFFWKLRDVLLTNDGYRQEYDDLKKRYSGRSMDEYRAAKNAFFEKLMQTKEFQAL